MGRRVTVETYVNIDVELEDINTDDLVEELESRGEIVITRSDKITQLIKIYELRKLGKSFERELDNYLYDVLGKLV